MKVYCTQEQFAAIREMKLRVDTTNDPADMIALIGQLSACVLDHGGDYNSALHLEGVPVEIVVLT